MLVNMGLARQELWRQGRGVLLPTVFDNTDDITSCLLASLAKRIHAAPAHKDAMGNDVEAEYGQGFSAASDESAEVTARLRDDIARDDWEPTVNESLRLVIPWARVKLGWWGIQRDWDGSPLWLVEDDGYTGQTFDEQKLEVIVDLRKALPEIEDA